MPGGCEASHRKDGDMEQTNERDTRQQLKHSAIKNNVHVNRPITTLYLLQACVSVLRGCLKNDSMMGLNLSTTQKSLGSRKIIIGRQFYARQKSKML